MPNLFCPHCGTHTLLTATAGEALHSPLVSEPQLRQRVAAGQARARRARRTVRGTFISHEAAVERDRLWFDWLYEKPGRAGGVERALFAQRDELGRFATDQPTIHERLEKAMQS